MFRRKMDAGLAVVHVLDDRIDVARVTKSGSARPAVTLCASFRKEESEIASLSRLRRELHLNRYRCATLMSAGSYQLQVLDAPDVPAQELKSAIRWKLKDALDYPVEQATIDLIAIPTGPGGSNRARAVYAVAARNEAIAERMNAFAQANLALSVIDIPEMAQRNIATLFEVERRALAMLSFSEQRGLLTFTSGGDLYLSRQIEIGLSQLISFQGEEKLQLFERIMLELQRSLDHFDRQFSFVPIAKVMLAPLPEELGLDRYLAENLYLPVEVARLDSALDTQAAPDLQQPAVQLQRFLALGAALRTGVAS